jgi:hypothetical protein
MTIQQATLTLSCPLCGQEHRYPITIRRAVVMQMHAERAPATEVRVTRLFTCPTKNEEFEGSLIIRETADSRIESVDVAGWSAE